MKRVFYLLFIVIIACSKEIETEIRYNLEVTVTPNEGGTVAP
jgi:hypothetical protein